MVLTHKIVNAGFFRGLGVADLATKYKVPITTIEHAIRIQLRRDIYIPPTQESIFSEQLPRQMTVSEVYGDMEIN